MPKKERGHLTQGDRMFIEEQLRSSAGIPDIARKLRVEPSTVRREVKRNAVEESPSFLVVESRNICLRKDTCKLSAICGNGCIMPCRTCKKSLCNTVCPEFKPNPCPWHTKPPYVCNDCRRRYGMGCGYEYRFYDGKMAHEAAEKRKSDSRAGVDCTREQLEKMAGFVRPLLKKGQSPENIWSNHGEKLPISLRTFYNYTELGVFDSIANLDLPKKVVFKIRKKKEGPPAPRHDLDGRTYGDFQNLPAEEQMNAVEMDCVVSDKAILTLLFRRFNFQFMLYLPAKNQAEVGRALDMLEGLIGARAFKKWFGTILTDRGSEFLDFYVLEKSRKGKGRRCRVFYCDPMKSGQKGRCEKNHVELRKIIPKGTSFQHLTPRKLAIVCSHVNSYGRPLLGGSSPYQLASQVLPEELFVGLGIERVAPEEVIMKPGLVDL